MAEPHLAGGRSPDVLLAQVHAAIESGRALCIRGSGSKDWYGEPPAGDLLDTRSHAGIIDYDPSELVITVRCGTPLAELESALQASGQMLACEPPHFGAGATVGGCIAAGLSGPRRASAGSVRDFLLGAKLINGRGQHLAFGGQVIKNVAGYDVSRLLAGSLGILGVLTEVSLKVVPRPVAETTLRFDGVSKTDALTRLNQWGGLPLPVSASAWHSGTLCLRLSGARAAVRTARASLGGDAVDADTAVAFWRGLREQTDPFFGQAGALWRLSVPSNSASVTLPAAGPTHGPNDGLNDGPNDGPNDGSTDGPTAGETDVLIEWGGAQRWLKTGLPADRVRAAALAAGGHATLFRPAAGSTRQAPCFARLDPVIAGIHRRLKAEFDPANLFNPGRLYADL